METETSLSLLSLPPVVRGQWLLPHHALRESHLLNIFPSNNSSNNASQSCCIILRPCDIFWLCLCLLPRSYHVNNELYSLFRNWEVSLQS